MPERLVGLEIEERGSIVIATLSGELDIADAAAVGDRLTSAVPTDARGLVVDFTALTFIDSSGIAMLFQLVRQLSARRQDLHVVVESGSAVARVLEIVEFERAAPLHGDLDSALGAFA